MNEPSTELNTPIAPQISKPFLRQQSLVVGMGISLIIIVLVGGYLLNQKNNLKKASVSTTIPISQTTKPTIIADEMVNWKTYTSSLGGFTLKYPHEWLMAESDVSPHSDIIYFYSKSPSRDATDGNYMCVQFRITDSGDEYPVKDSKTIKELDGGLKINQINVHAAKSIFPALQLTKKGLSSINLSTGKKLTAQASFNCMQGDIDNVKLTYDQQAQSKEYIQAREIFSTFKFTDQTTNHIDIKEWGVRLSMNDADKITYKITNNSINFYLKDSVTIIEDCKELGVNLSRDTNNPDGLALKIGNYFYRFNGGPGTCNEDPGGSQGSINKLRSKINKEFSQDALTLI